jgi:ATP-binding cassette subfamily B protein
MVMDEPTASLDPLMEAQIYKDFAKLSQDKTTIMVTHRLGSVTQADKIIVLKDGKIIESGNHETLITQDGEYAEMFNTQARHYRKNAIVTREGRHPV